LLADGHGIASAFNLLAIERSRRPSRYSAKIDAEQRLVTAAGIRDGTVVDRTVVDLALLEMAANGTALDGRSCRPRRANRHSHRHTRETHLVPPHGGLPDWATGVGPATLIIIDEAGMADTLSLDTAVQFAFDRGASVRLVGDDQQLAAIGAGGVLRDIQQGHGALHLTELHRFTDPAEAHASLTLREGDPRALGFYLDHGRVHVGDLAKITEDAFTAWISRPSRRTRHDHARSDPRACR
jgi:hypothetical protein